MMADLVVAECDATPVAVQGLRPYCIARVSGLPVEEVDRLRSPDTMSAYRALVAADRRIIDRRDALGQLLFDEIGRVDDKGVRNSLLRARRALFNGREPRAADAAAVQAALPQHLSALVLDQLQLLAERSALRSAFESRYAAELCASRRRLQEALADEDFQKGLVMSSESLFVNLNKYRTTQPDAFGSREEQIERGLLRYFSRSAMKATPFGTFCGIAAGRFVATETPHRAGRGSADYEGDPREKKAFVRINKALFGILWACLKGRPAIRNLLVVELSPSATFDEVAVRFLTSMGGQEVFQRLERNEALDEIIPLLRDSAGLRFGDLVLRLCEMTTIDATLEEVTSYLDQLTVIGLLRFRSGIREKDADWDLPFAAFLDGIDDDYATKAAALLRELRRNLEAYGTAPAAWRAQIGVAIHEIIDNALRDLEITPSFSDPPFYEDAAANAALSIQVGADVSAALNRMAELAQMLMQLSFIRDQQADMRHFFDTYYGAATRCVPLLTFYEDYYREHLKNHLQQQRDAERGLAIADGYDVRNPFKLDAIASRAAAGRRITDIIRRHWANDERAIEISVGHDELAPVINEIAALPRRERSVSAFCQLDIARDQAIERPSRVVLQKVTFFSGRGKYLSRFLYLLPPTMLDQVYADNNASEKERRAEICADGDFNANLHPPLLRWEISYPTSESGSTDDQLLSADIEVARDSADPFALQLFHRPSGAAVVPFDLGFLNPQMRPALYQLLSRFTQPGQVGIRLPDILREAPRSTASSGSIPPGQPGSMQQAAELEDRIEYRPRITYERLVVLARRRWSVPHSLFPRRDAAETDAQFFFRVNRWRESHGIPEQVYIRIQPKPNRTRSSAVVSSEKQAANAIAALESESELVAVTDGVEPITGDGALSDGGTLAAESNPEVEAQSVARSPAESGAPVQRETNQTRKSAQGNGRRDWHKPQFIDFASPLLVKLFAQSVAGVREFIMHLEERLPEADGLPRAETGCYSTELVVQFDFPAS